MSHLGADLLMKGARDSLILLSTQCTLRRLSSRYIWSYTWMEVVDPDGHYSPLGTLGGCVYGRDLGDIS